MAPLRADFGRLPGLEGRRPLNEAVASLRVAGRRRDGTPLELVPPTLVEQPSACERMNVADEAVRGTENVSGSAVEILEPELAAPLLPKPVRRLAPRLDPALRTGPLVHHLRREHRARRSPHQLPARVCDVGLDAGQQPFFLPGFGG